MMAGWAASGLFQFMAGPADARPPTPTPCLGSNCGTNAQGFVQYGSAGATFTGTTVNINQTTSKAILNWADFNIASGYTVRFLQPSATAAVLNKIWSSDPSVIAGNLQANGQVYLYNQNGIVFDKGAQVDVGSLVASTMAFAPVTGSTDPDALFKNGLLSNNANALLAGTLPPAFAPCATCNAIPGSVSVNAGATLASNDGGRIMLLGSAVSNQGTISTPDGQAIIGAGSSAYLAASTDPSLRGLLIEVGGGAASGLVTNTGSINAPRGNVTLAGLIVKQAGQVSATTSVSANGSIFLVAGDASSTAAPAFVDLSAPGFGGLLPNEGGTLILEPGSVTNVLPDTGTGTITAQSLANGAFYPSQVGLVGQTVSMLGSASIRAPGAVVGLSAAANPYQQSANLISGTAGADGGRVYVDAGAVIDVSGLKNVAVPVTNEVIQVTLEGNDLQDVPLLRTGFLHGQQVTVNASQGSTLFNVAPYTANIPSGIDQILTAAGSIRLNSDGDVITRAGSMLNVSGGSVAFQGGFAPSTTKLLGADGRVYDIGSAPNDIQYVGLANAYAHTDPTWGTQTKTNALSYYSGYLQGGSAGSIQVLSPQVYLRGAMEAVTVAGIYQRNPSSLPQGGQFSLGCNCTIGGGGSSDFRAPAVQFADGATDGLDPNFGYTNLSLSADLAKTTLLSPTQLAQSGFDRLTVFSNGPVTLAAGTTLRLAPGPSAGLAVTSDQAIEVDGNIVAPGATISLTTLPQSPSDSTPHNVTLAPGAGIDVSGQWINDSPFVTTTPGTAPLVINGGSVGLAADGGVLLGSQSRIDVSGGGWFSSNGKLSTGGAGTINLNASFAASPTSAYSGNVQFGTGVTLLGDALSAGKGGTLSVSSGSVTIGAAATGSPGELVLSPGFFNGRGFNRYNVTGENDLLIGGAGSPGLDAVVLSPIQETLVFTRNSLLEPTGTNIDYFTALQALPATQRSPVSLYFSTTANSTGPGIADNGDLVLGRNASIVTDPGAAVSLAVKGKSGNLSVFGTVLAPAGTIDLQLAGGSEVLSPDASIGYLPAQQIVLGPQAILSAPAAALIDTLDLHGYPEGKVLGGGTISLQANKGYVVTDPGSLINVSGAVGVIDVAGTYGVTPTTLAGAAGTIAIDAREGIVLQGSLLGQPATIGGIPVAGAAGGTLSLGLDLYDYGATANSNAGSVSTLYPTAARTLTVVSPDAYVQSNQLQSGTARIDSSSIGSGGFDNVILKSADVIAFDGAVSLSSRASLTLDAPLLQGDPGAVVKLAAAHVALGNYLNQSDYFDTPLNGAPPNPNVAAVLAPGCGIGPCTASLGVTAQLIDVRGVSGMSGFSTESLNSSGDIRLSAAQQPFNTPPPLETPAGDPSFASLRAGLQTDGRLTLAAAQVYPTTNTDFTITAANPAGSSVSSVPAAVTIIPTSGVSAVPLSAGGILTINAPTINQDGVLRAPMGEITLQGVDTVDSATGLITAAGAVNLSSGSLTSVSAAGSLIPFGATVNGQQWTYSPDAAITEVVATPPVKTVNLNGSQVVVGNQGTSTGAKIVNLAGGGDLYAYEWIAGPGGSTDVLDPNAAANGAGLKPYQYAILPTLNSQFAPIDPQYAAGTSTGNQTIYLSGVPGLAAGVYALLPARYALLPGAYALQITKDTNIASGSAVIQPNGSYIAAGRLGIAGTDIADSQTSTVLLASSAVVNTQAQYNSTYANQFFSNAAAATKAATPSLPADAGLLQISATKSLSVNDGIDFAAGTYTSGATAGGMPVTVQGAGGAVSIQAPNILVVDTATPATAGGVPGAVRIDAGSLDNLGAQTLVLGAIAQNSAKGEQLTVGVTQGVELDNTSVPLVAPELIFAAQNQIAVDAGAQINAKGVLNQSPSALILEGGGALLLASGGAAAPLQIGTSVAQNSAGLLSVGSKASLQAAGDLLLYSSGNTTAQPDATLAAPALGLYSSRVSLGDVPSGAAAPDGLNITSQLLGELHGLRALTIGSTSTIDLYGAVSLGAATSANPGLSSVTLDAAAVDGYGDGAKTLQAGLISLIDSNSASPAATGFYASPPTGTGALTLRATASTTAGSGQIDLGSGAKLLNGFSAVNLVADGAIQGQDTGSLALSGSGGAAVPLLLQGAALSATSASSQSILTAGGVTIAPAPASKAVISSAPLGGALSIQGGSIAQNGVIDLPEGLITLSATAGDLNLGKGSVTSAAGMAQGFVVTNSIVDGGSIALRSANGNVTVQAGATVDVSGARSADGKQAGNAGSLTVAAPGGVFDFAGASLDGKAPVGGLPGNFTLDVGSGLSGAGLSTLDTALAADGFSGAVSLRTRGDTAVSIAAGDVVSATSYELAVDAGSITLAGTINTSGGRGPLTDGGSIALWAGTGLAVQGGAKLLADGTASGAVGINGAATPAHGGDITLGTRVGAITFDGGTPGAPTTVSARGTGGASTDGAFSLRAPRTPDDANVQLQVQNGASAQIDTRRPVVVEGFKAYSATALGGADANCGAGGTCGVADFSGVLFTDAATFMAGSAAIVTATGFANNTVQVRPGIEVDSPGDLNLDNTTNSTGVWDLNSWTTALGAPVNLALRAAGNLLFNVSLTDGFVNNGKAVPNWTFGESATLVDSSSYRLTAGADLSAANPLATVTQPRSAAGTSGIPNSGNLILTPGNLIRTGDGNIDVSAGGDVMLGYTYSTDGSGNLQVAESDPLSSVLYTAGIPSVLTPAQALLFTATTTGGKNRADVSYPTQGGSITVSAADDILSAPSAQLVSDWLWRRGSLNPDGTLVNPKKNASWWITFGNFQQGIGALGGGDVSLSAGGNIVNLSAVLPSTGRLLGAAGDQPSLTNLVTTGGGTLRVQAGGDIQGGVFENDLGNSVVRAGGALAAGATLGQELPNLDLAAAALSASTPTYPVLVEGSGTFNVDARAGAAVNLVANSTSLPEYETNGTAATTFAYFYTYGPASTLNVRSAGGDVNLYNEFANLPIGILNVNNQGAGFPVLYDSSNYEFIYPGTLNVAATSGNIGILNNGVNLFPSAIGNLSLLARNDITGSTSQDLTSKFAVTLYETDPAQWSSPVLPAVGSEIPGASAQPLVPLYQNASLPVTIVAETGGISPSTMTLPKSANVIAGGDIADLTYLGKNLNPSDVTLIEAGGNIAYSTPTQAITNALERNQAGISVAGPGYLEVLAGGSLNLGDSAGIVTTGSLADSRLSSAGAAIVAGAGFGASSAGGLRQPADQSFIKQYLGPTSTGSPSSYATTLVDFMAQLDPAAPALTYTAALAGFKSLSAAQQLPLIAQVLNDELSATGIAHNTQGTDYSRGYKAIDALFPTKDSSGAAVPYNGDINMFFSQIKTEQGGDINLLAPGGSVVVGLPNPPASLDALKATFNPDVASAANLGLLVLGSGAIQGFADQSFEVNRSRVLTLEGGNIILWASNGSIDAGRGAKSASGAPPPVIETDANGNVFVNPLNDVSGSGIGQLITGPGQTAGLVNLIAPKGVVNAGDAGIRVAGNLNIAAVQVIGAANITVVGTSTGVPQSQAGALSGALSGANSLGDASKSAVDQLAQDIGNAGNYQQLTESLLPNFIVVKMFCLGIECEQH